MTSKLDDAHVELFSPDYDYSPKLVLRYAENQYVVVKSGYPQIAKGDIITSIGGTPTSQMEDSLRQYISEVNPDVFRREVCRKMLLGEMGSYINIGYKDSSGNAQSVSYVRFSSINNSWFYDYSPNEYISSIKWKKWDCNVGFVNMGMLKELDVKSMYSGLYYTSAMVIDLRSDLEGATWSLADLIYPKKKCFAKLTIPDVKYP